MKTLLGALALLFLSAPSVASAHGLEAITINKFTRVKNDMPILRPGNKPGLRSNKYFAFDFEVMSNGCTKAKDFQFRLYKRAGRTLLAAIRTKRDTCKAATRIVKLSGRVTANDRNFRRPIYVLNPLLGHYSNPK